MANALYGEENPNYHGGVTKLRSSIRNSRPYRDWKELIFQRDRYKCVDCGELGDNKILQAHHTEHEFSDILQEFLLKYPKLSPKTDEKMLLMLAGCYAPFWNIRNGVTLCKKCHIKRHETDDKTTILTAVN